MRMRALVLVLVLMLARAAAFPAQQPDSGEDRVPRFLVALGPSAPPRPLDVARTPVLRRRIALHLRNATLARALESISRQAGVRLMYSKDLVPLERRVTLEADAITVVAALTEVLLDANVDVVFSGIGQAALVRRTEVRDVLPGAGSVVGWVTDGKTGAAVANAEVFLGGTRWRTATDTAGRYRLVEVEARRYTLVVRRIGYAKYEQAVTVGEREDTVNVALEPQATRLDELVSTATGQRRRLQVPNDITLIDADSVMRTQPIRSVTDILEGRVPGLLVQRTSGAPGDPARLRLRGASSPTLNNDPIVVVDGIRVYAEQSATRSANLAALAGLGSLDVSTNYTYAAPSPLDYIDPNSIETLEVVKGPSAATLYGQDAANGVIVITTKKGQAGPTRWTMSVNHGVTEMVGQYPERLLRWGHTRDHHLVRSCPVVDFTLGITTVEPCVADSIVRFQLLNDPDLTPFGRGHRTAGNLGVSGGVRSLTYSVNGSYSHELGLLRLPDVEIARYEARIGQAPPDWMRRPQAFTQWGVASQLGAQLGPKADLSFRVSLSQVDQRRSELERQLGDLDATYFDRASGIYHETHGLQTVELLGTLRDINSSDYALDNYYTKVTSATTALTTGAQLNWRPWTWLSTRADAGINVIQRADVLFLRRRLALGNDSVGILSDGQGRSLVHTLNLNATAIRPLGGFTLRLSTGVNYNSEAVRDAGMMTRNLPPGQMVPGDTARVPIRNEWNKATFGWFVEPALDHGRFSLISGLRLDGGSSYGGGLSLPTFPKLGGSWLISDEPFFPFKGLFSSLRLRAAYGRAGRQPDPDAKLRLYGATRQFPVDGQSVPVTELEKLGNTQLRPERSSELEGGLDADLFHSRLSLEVSGYRKTTHDAIVGASLPPSIGIGSIVRNIGVTRNTGLEATLGTTLVRGAPVTWMTNLTLTYRRDEVVRLGPGVAPFTAGDDQRVVPGYPLFGYWAKPVLGYTDMDGDGTIERGEVVLGDTTVYRGSPLPNYTATLSSSVGLWNGALRLTADLLYENGMTQHLGTDLINRQVGLSAGRNDPTASPAEQALVVSTMLGTNYYWYQQVSTTRLNALAVNYTVPQTLARRLGAERLSLSLQGANLGLWSSYPGVDPNVNGAATGNLVIDNGQLPRPRTWQVRIDASY